MNETEHGLAEAFRAGRQDAATWLALVRVNDIRAAVQACQRDSLWLDKVGCRANPCGVGSAYLLQQTAAMILETVPLQLILGLSHCCNCKKVFLSSW